MFSGQMYVGSVIECNVVLGGSVTTFWAFVLHVSTSEIYIFPLFSPINLNLSLIEWTMTYMLFNHCYSTCRINSGFCISAVCSRSCGRGKCVQPNICLCEGGRKSSSCAYKRGPGKFYYPGLPISLLRLPKHR